MKPFNSLEWRNLIRMFPVKHCGGCGKLCDRRNQRYCKHCHATWMREWRKINSLTSEQRFKANCRSYAGVYERRGKLIPEPCERCGASAEKHHSDYTQPLLVVWLCRQCHLDLHYNRNFAS